jgi:starch-binding outer membrane protein, SusD/RagB family
MKVFKISILAVSAIITFAACSKSKLEPSPQNALLESQAFTTAGQVENNVRGMYAGLKSGNFLGGRFHVYQDIRGEEFTNITNNGVTNLQTWNFTQLATINEVQNCWSQGYAAINRCNVVIDGVNRTAAITPAQKIIYVAEARFVRAVSYFSLMNLYARPYLFPGTAATANLGIPLRWNAETAINNASNQQARAPINVIYDSILSDLNFAETNLLATNGSPSLNATRAHKNSAIAFKTRVLLAMGRWNDVLTEGNKMVPAMLPVLPATPASVTPVTSVNAATNAANRLEPSYQSVFSTLGVNSIPNPTAEHIFALPFTDLDQPGVQNGLASYYNPGPVGNGDYQLNIAAPGIYANAAFGTADSRRSYVSILPAAPGSATLRYWYRKFNQQPNYDLVPIIRFAEIMLNVAEADVRATNSVSQRAVDILNYIIRRSNNTTFTAFTTASFATPQALIDRILLERRIEFLGEGLRSFDVQRTNQSFGTKGIVSAVAPTSNLYIWPIPQNELLVNSACVQNTGY